VRRIAHRHRAQAVLPGFLDRQLHRAVSRGVTHPMMSVNERRRAFVGDNLHLRRGELHPGLDAVVVILEPPHPVRLDPAQVRGDQNIRANPRVLVRHALCLKRVDHKGVEYIHRKVNRIVVHRNLAFW